MSAMRATRVVADATPADLDLPALLAADRPVILRGLARDWPLVRAGAQGPAAAMDYLRQFDAGHPVVAYRGDASIGGRFFYRDDLTAFNFTADRVPLSDALGEIAATLGRDDAEAIYIGSTAIDRFLPGLRAANDLSLPTPAPGHDPALASIWIGNRTVAATHWDMSNNLACCAVGRRRFTLFPPDQVANLYPGPIEPTPGGQIVSMVDPAAPDIARYPRFAAAQAAGEVADLIPGDVLFYPALWWHNVEALDPFNVLVNYWWNEAPAFLDPPMTTLLHAILSLRDRPPAEKTAWRAMFDHYIFSEEEVASHLPPAARGELARLDDPQARRLRARLIRRLNR